MYKIVRAARLLLSPKEFSGWCNLLIYKHLKSPPEFSERDIQAIFGYISHLCLIFPTTKVVKKTMKANFFGVFLFQYLEDHLLDLACAEHWGVCILRVEN